MDTYSTKGAIQYAENGQIEQWIHGFLATVGNNKGLLARLKKKRRYFVGPRKVELDKLQRLCGPESTMKFHEPQEKWDERVNRLFKKIEKGWDAPPLLVMYYKKKLFVVDGNHRFEVYQKLRYKEAWAIVCFSSMKSLTKVYGMKPPTFFIAEASDTGKVHL